MTNLPKNNDLVFDVIYNLNTSQIESIKEVTFTFYTDGETTIEYTKENITDGQLFIPWSDLQNLNDGIIKYNYHVNFDNSNFADGTYDSTGNEITELYLKK